MNVQRTPTIVPRMLSVPTHLARSTARATVVTMEMDVPVQVRCVAGPSCSIFCDYLLYTFIWFLRLSATNFLCWATFINSCFLMPDIDECTKMVHNCSQHAQCTNTVGSFTCACNSRYYGDGVNCAGDSLLHSSLNVAVLLLLVAVVLSQLKSKLTVFQYHIKYN